MGRKNIAGTLLGAAIAITALTGASDQDGFGRGGDVPATMPLGSDKGNPLYEMPPGQTLISAFGERPVFSPDGRKLAFIGQSYGDAFEFDLATGITRNLTAHAPHKGFLRVHYLSDGSYLLLGARLPAKTREETRFSRIEMFWMDSSAERAPLPLGPFVFEGVATSSESNLIGWSEINIDTGKSGAATTSVYTARVVVEGGRPRIADKRAVMTSSDCLVEAQDFLAGDRALTMPCYGYQASRDNPTTKVLSVDLATGNITHYPTPEQIYSEVEGAFPGGRRTLVECAADRTRGMDICVLDLDPARPRYTRMTEIVRFGGFKYGNPVVHPGGKMIAAQIGPADVIDAGVGEGIVLMRLKSDF